MSLFVDVHSHLDRLSDLDGAVNRAKSAGVVSIITAGLDSRTNRLQLEMARKYPLVKPALGLYPRDVWEKDCLEEHIPFVPTDLETELIFFAKNIRGFLALGEIGLDYKYPDSKKDQQKSDFKKLLLFAKKHNKPVIVHSRKAEVDVLDLLESNSQKKVVLHCFNGSKALIKRAAKLGYSFSVPTNVVRSENFQDLIREVNLSQLFTETDSPFLSPFKGVPNEPSFVVESVKKIAQVKSLDLLEVENVIYMNYQKMFIV